jgi:hypothetical protein
MFAPIVSAEVVNPGFLPGGYGTESHNHLLGNGHGHVHEPVSAPVREAEPEAA